MFEQEKKKDPFKKTKNLNAGLKFKVPGRKWQEDSIILHGGRKEEPTGY